MEQGTLPNSSSPAKPKQTSGFLMSIVRTLSTSADFEQREKEKARIEKAFKESDKKLGELVKENYKELTSILTNFSSISDKINESRDKIKKIKDDLSSCKTLLHCKRDELRRLWIEGVEQKTVASLLDKIEQVKNVPDRLDRYLAKKDYLHSTDVIKELVSAVTMLETALSGVEALRDLKVEILSRKERMHEILIEELNRQIYIASAQVMQRRSGRRSEMSVKAMIETASGQSDGKSSAGGDEYILEREENPQKSIANLIESLFILRKIPDAAEAIKSRMHPELIAIVARGSHQVIENFGSQGENLSTQFQPRHLLELLEIVVCQFRCVANIHKVVLQNLHRIIKSGVYIKSEYMYTMQDVWSKIQAVIQLLLEEYLDVRNTEKSRQQTPTGFDEPSMDIGIYFAKKKPQKPKKVSLFRFDASIHALSTNSYVEDTKQFDSQLFAGSMRPDAPKHIFVCKPSVDNVKAIFKPLQCFIREVEMEIDNGTSISSLRVFLTDFIEKVYLGHVHFGVSNNINLATKGFDALRNVIDHKTQKELGVPRPLLQSTVTVDKSVLELRELMTDLPDYADQFLNMICNVLKGYWETCHSAYRGIVQYDSDEKRVISAMWAKDQDISRFLRSLPSWRTLQPTDGQELNRTVCSEEEMRALNSKEAVILISNLSSDEAFIPQHEIITDVTQMRTVANVHESLEWFSTRLRNFSITKTSQQMQQLAVDSPLYDDVPKVSQKTLEEIMVEPELFWTSLPGLPNKMKWPVKVIEWDEDGTVTVYCRSDDAYFRVKQSQLITFSNMMDSFKEKGICTLKKRKDTLSAFLDDVKWAQDAGTRQETSTVLLDTLDNAAACASSTISPVDLNSVGETVIRADKEISNLGLDQERNDMHCDAGTPQETSTVVLDTCDNAAVFESPTISPTDLNFVGETIQTVNKADKIMDTGHDLEKNDMICDAGRLQESSTTENCDNVDAYESQTLSTFVLSTLWDNTYMEDGSDVDFIPGSEDESECENVCQFAKFLGYKDSKPNGSVDSTVEKNDVLSSEPEVDDFTDSMSKKRTAVKEKEIIRDVEYPDVYIRKQLKNSGSSSGQAYKKKHDRVYNNYHCCYFCGEMFLHIPVHMKVHRHIPAVAQKLKEEKPDFTSLRKMGDDKHNRDVVEQKKGELIISRKSNNELLDASKYGPCVNCKEWCLLSGLKKHYKKCGKEEGKGLGKKDLVLKAQILAGHIKGKPSKMMLEEVYRIMKDDDCTRTAQKDLLIVSLGESWLRRNYDNFEKRKYYASGRMRLCARLLNALKAQNQQGEPNEIGDAAETMWDFLVPSKFDQFVAASLSVCVPYMDDLDDLRAPSNALKLKYDIRRLLNAKYAFLLKENGADSSKLKECKRFLVLMEIEWSERVTKVARTVLQTRQLTEKKEIPAPEDVEKLTKHLVSELERTKLTPENYTRLVQLCQTRLLLFNKRRSGELEVLDLQSYLQRSRIVSDLDLSVSKDLTEVEKHLLESQGLVMIRGKRGRPVPVIVPKDANKSLEYITNAEARLLAGVQKGNKYLFANTGNQYVRAYDSLKSVCDEVSLKAPGRITSVTMRKYMATLTQLMGLDKYQLDWVCKHLGHTKSVHNTAYRQMSGMVERVYISKLLMIQDLNLTGKFKGQNLENIDVAELLAEHHGWTPESDTEMACGSTEMACGSTELPIECSVSDVEPWENEETSSEDNSDEGAPRHKRRKVTKSTRQKWSDKEVAEIKKYFRCYLDAGITPRQDAVKSAIERSKKENGALWMRKTSLIIKKISNMNKIKRHSLNGLVTGFQDLADICLLLLHLEVRVHCFYYLMPVAKQSNYAGPIDDLDPDSNVLKLNKDLTSMEEVLSQSLQPKKFKYIFESLGYLVASILMNSMQFIKKINENGIKKMCRNLFAIQQNLTNITMSRESDLDHARQYYELLYLNPGDILTSIAEKGPQFTMTEYTQLIDLWHRSHVGVDATVKAEHLQRLREVTEKGQSETI